MNEYIPLECECIKEQICETDNNKIGEPDEPRSVQQ